MLVRNTGQRSARTITKAPYQGTRDGHRRSGKLPKQVRVMVHRTAHTVPTGSIPVADTQERLQLPRAARPQARRARGAHHRNEGTVMKHDVTIDTFTENEYQDTAYRAYCNSCGWQEDYWHHEDTDVDAFGSACISMQGHEQEFTIIEGELFGVVCDEAFTAVYREYAPIVGYVSDWAVTWTEYDAKF